ncbi:MAG TPA: hypothetical protein PLL06_08180 [Acidobacteriota bacterium]|nr:hypothetical protein [Acidobacteriota bacterium]
MNQTSPVVTPGRKRRGTQLTAAEIAFWLPRHASQEVASPGSKPQSVGHHPH